MGIANDLGMRYNKLSNQGRAELIEYWLSNPDITMMKLGQMFQISEFTASRIIRLDYFGMVENKRFITRQSKINIPEYELITID